MRIHRQWFILGGASLAFLIGGSAMGVSAIENASKGPAFDLSAACLQVNREAQQQLGVITGFGLAVSGPVVDNTDGTGRADIDFDVLGSWRTGHAHLRLTEDANRWQWTGQGWLTVAGRRYPIDLVQTNTMHPRRYLSMCAPPSSITHFRPT